MRRHRATATGARCCAAVAFVLIGAQAARAMATDIPYAWSGVRIGGGGYVSGLVFHPREAGLLYARTDVGGAYRWDASHRQWMPLTDWIDADHANLAGIDAMAVDPSDPSAIYLVGGTYTNERGGLAALMRSHDRGATFDVTELPFPMGGNELGRGNGERLAVDPHDGNVMLLGTRNAGLWRSKDVGVHWSRVAGFPDVATSVSSTAANNWRRQPIGIVFVEFDAGTGKNGRPTDVIYAGVSTQATSLYRSNDAGEHWAPVAHQPIGLRPTHMHPLGNGNYALVYNDEPGPDTTHDGAIYRYQPHGDHWADITPVPRDSRPSGHGWGDIAVDPHDPRILVATTFGDYSPHDRMFRSTDGGAHWLDVFPRSTFDHSEAPWTQDHTPHWMSRVAIDPFDAGRVLFVTGYGIWASRDIRALDAGGTVVWTFEDAGLEETVPLGLVSPAAGAPLVSAVGDLDGFRHDTLDHAPLQLAGPPRYQNAESLDVAGRAPNVIVRTGRIRGKADQVRAAVSRDGASTWHALASEPPEGNGAGVIAVAADGRAILWLPDGAATSWLTTDDGDHWRASEGLKDATQVVADRYDPRRFYAAGTGAAYVSHDGGQHFAQLGGTFGSRIASDPDRHASMIAAPGSAGSLWWISRQQGLVRGRDDGTLGRAVTSITSASSLGFGRPAPGTVAPTLFVAGKRDGKRGIYRSTDDGATWQRINDDAHQFGQVAHVTGDPRVFGRVYFATGGRGIFQGNPSP